MTRFLAVLGLLAVVACSKKEPPAPEPLRLPAAAVPAPSASVAAAPSASAAAAPEVPVEEDFEQEATVKLNAQTLDAQLDALEKEIKAN